MAITIKTAEDIEAMREGGKRLATIMQKLVAMAKAGVTTKALDAYAEKLVREGGDTPSFLNYKPYGAKRAYPASLCVSINDEVVHGIPNENDRVLKDGDIVSLDMGLIHEGYFLDHAVTIGIGTVAPESAKLIADTKEALMIGIKAARGGNTTGDIGYAIERFARPLGYGIVEELAGHGVGYEVHEDPYVPNTGEKGKGAKLKPGMTLAIEPMLNLGTARVQLAKDGYTYRTEDGKPSAHFEHTVLISKGGAEILTLA